MASIPTEQKSPAAGEHEAGELKTLLVWLPPLTPDELLTMLANLGAAFRTGPVIVRTTDQTVAEVGHALPSNLHLLHGSPDAAIRRGGWVLTAAEFAEAYRLAAHQGAAACLLLGAESQTISIEALQALGGALLSGADLVMSRYGVGPREGLVNSAILYPVSRAVFGTHARFPLAPDLGLSLRMAARMEACAGRFLDSGQGDALLWPLSEAAVAGYVSTEVPVIGRTLPSPNALDLNTLLGNIVGSLFADIDARAAFWQRTRVAAKRIPDPSTIHADAAPAITLPMQDAFRLAYTNLGEIWSLVLPPNSLLGLKRLSQAPPDQFRMPDVLWARIVYDFLLAFRLRTINRGHLLGALTPLYLAWVASHLELIAAGVEPEQHIEQQAEAFESDKAYLVSRWRWPDRFNP